MTNIKLSQQAPLLVEKIDQFALLEDIPIGVSLIEPDGTVRFWNRCLETWTNINKESILGQKINTYFSQFNSVYYRQELEEILETGKPKLFSANTVPPLISFIDSLKKFHFCQTTVTLIRLEEDRKKLLMLSIQDQTEQMTSKWENSFLQRDIKGYKALFFDNKVIRLLLSQRCGNIEEVNKVACKFYGYDYETFKKMKISDLVVLPNGQPVSEKFLKALTYQGCFTFSHRLASSEIYQVEVYATEVIIEEQKFLDCIIHDITHQVEAQKKIKQLTRFLDNIIQSSPLSIVITDLKGIIKTWNHSAENTLGWKNQEVVEQNITIFPATFQELLTRSIEQIQLGNNVYGWETQQQTKDGAIIDTITFSSSLYDTDNLLSGCINIIENITEQKKIAEALRLNDEQERIIDLIALKIRQSLNLSEVLQTAVTEIQKFLNVDQVTIYHSCKTEECQVVVGKNSCSSCYFDLGKNLFGLLKIYQDNVLPSAKGSYKSLSDISQSDLAPCLRKILANFGIKSQLSIPIYNGKVWGWLILHHCQSIHEWQPWEIKLLQRLEAQLSIAIQQALLYQELENLATHDSLTGIANRRYFDDYLSQQWACLSRERLPLSLIMCDIDYFKAYNDIYGHVAGDNCLIQVAQILTQCVKRPADIVARYGGEEFVILLPKTHRQGAIQIVERIQTEIKQLQMIHSGSLINQQLTVSMGIATVIPTTDKLPESIIKAADKALYQAKALGRDRYC